MTPNGAVIFGLVVVAASVAAASPLGFAVVAALVLAFAIAGGGRKAATALLWSAGIVAPLALFMGLVWVVIVGRAPAEIAAGVEGSRIAAAAYVAVICARLFIIAFVVQAAFQHFAGATPLRFVRGLTVPLTVKKLLVLTLSLIETLLQAVDRARTALIVSGTITRQFSLRNLRHGWILIQTVWLTVITIAIGRTRDKWPTEGTLTLLDNALSAPAGRRFAAADLIWITLAVAALASALGLR